MGSARSYGSIAASGSSSATAEADGSTNEGTSTHEHGPVTQTAVLTFCTIIFSATVSGPTPLELTLRLLDRHCPFLTRREPTRPDLSEPVLVSLLAPISRLERFAEFLLLDRFQVGEVRRESRTEVRVEGEGEELAFGPDGLVGVSKDLGKSLEDRFDVDCFESIAAAACSALSASSEAQVGERTARTGRSPSGP